MAGAGPKSPLTGPTPGHRYQPVMVYDRARARTVLYGGIGGPSDTWEWDGQRWRANPCSLIRNP